MTVSKNPQILLAVLLLIVLVASINAQVPQLISYQGRLTNGSGEPIPDASYSIIFAIYDGTETVLWQETHASVTTSDGLFSVLLGAGDHSGYGELDETIFSDSLRWLGIKVGEDPEITPRTRLVSVPYAHQATHAYDADISPPLSMTAADVNPIIEGINTGSGAGLRGEASAATGRGVIGEALNSGPGTNEGGHFVAAGQTGVGVYGQASNTDDVLNYGGRFEAAGEQGIGVSGFASADFSENYGGFFIGRGDHGRGVHGEASSQAGKNYGGYFRSRGAPGYGVYGWASNASGGTSYGGYFISDANAGRGVYGEATSMSPGNTYGGYFTSASGAGVGVHGEATNDEDIMNYGGFFGAAGEQGVGVRGDASNNFGENYGGHFTASGDYGCGVYGAANRYGGYFRANGSTGTAIYGWADNTSGINFGIHGRSDSPDGYAGYFEGNVNCTDTVQTAGFKMTTNASDVRVLTSDTDGNGTWQAAFGGESGEFDGAVNSDMVEDPGANTVINFSSPFTSTEKPHMYIVVVLKAAADGLVEGAAVKAVEDVKGTAGNWTGFDIAASKYSGGSITDLTTVYVTWMAIGR